MAESKEQLKIEAELDISKLKREAQQGMQSVANETKKVENQAKQASKAIDDIGASANKAAQKGTQALKQMSNEAGKVTQNVEKLSQTVKNINFKQGLQVANQAINQLAPIAIGALTSSGVMSQDAGEFTGNLISGTMAGAMTGATLGSLAGPGVGTAIGAAAGAITGAATTLLESSFKFKEAAELNAKNATEQANALVEGYDKGKANKAFNDFLSTATTEELRSELAKQEKSGKRSSFDVGYMREQLDWAKDQLAGAKDKYETAAYAKIVEDYTKKLANAIEEETETQNKINAIKAKIEITEKRAQAIAEAEEKRREQIKESQGKQIADIERSKEESSKLRDIETQIKTGGDVFEPIMADLKERSKAAFQKMKDSVGDEDAFNAAKNEYNFLQQAMKTAQGAEQSRLGDILSGLEGEKSGVEKELDSTLNIGRGYKLTDSLTNVGGGSGYYAQMSGVNGYVKDISTTLKESMKNILEKMNTIIDRQGQAETAVYAD